MWFGTIVAQQREPEAREAGQHAALVGDLGRAGRRRRSRCGRWRRAAGARRRGRRSRGPSRMRRVRPQAWTGSSLTASSRRAKTVSTWRVYAARSKTASRSMRDAISSSARHELAEVELLVPGAHRVALDEAVGVVAREARLDEREQHALAEEEVVARLEVAAHPLGAHDEAVDEPREAVEHVVEREERVGDDDALGRRVRDVALVPERDVLEPDERVPADDAREPADPLGDDGVALVRHRRRALLALAERLLHLGDLGAREVPDLERERVERRRDDRERARGARRAGRAGGSASRSAPARARAARTRCARARDRSRRTCRRRRESLPTRMPSSARATRARPRSSSNAQPASFSPKVVGSACTPCVRPICSVVAVLLGPCDDGGERAVEPGEDRARRPRGSGARARCRRRRRR